MSTISDRYAKVADGFRQRVDAVPAGAWDNPAPCAGWVARDVVRHLVEWLPAFFFETWGIDDPSVPSVDVDPAGAWVAVDGAIRRALADPAVADGERDTPMGRQSFALTIDTICTGDLLVHTWDLARATGLDETLDAGEVHRQLESMEPFDEAMRSSGHFGPKVAMPAGADEQTQLLAFVGRRV